MLVADEANRWNWDDLFEVLLGKINNRVRVKTPVGTIMFYIRPERAILRQKTGLEERLR